MRTLQIKKQAWQSIMSVFAFGVFIYFALGSLGGAQQKHYLGNGIYEIAKYYGNGNTELIQGPVDDHGNWHGTTTFQYEDENGIMVSKEEVNMTNGLRNGISKTTFASGRVYTVCYEMGERVDCDKSAKLDVEQTSAYESFSYKYPWMITSFDAFGFNEEYVKAFIDTFEMLINANEFALEDFNDYYGDVGDFLEETPYDSIIQVNSEISSFNGIELSQFDEFRYAVHDQFRAKGSTTYDIIKQTYPNYLLLLNQAEVNDADFMRFCEVFDSIMATYTPMGMDDPDLIDSLDNRMYETISFINSDYEGSIVAEETLKSMDSKINNPDISDLIKFHSQVFNREKVTANPSEVSGAIITLIVMKYINGDKIRLALMESYAKNQGIVTLPTVITSFQERNSSSSVTISASVTDDGGGEITSRGIAWSTGFNPDKSNDTIPAGLGTGNFVVTIDELSEDIIYYVRAYATNSAGTSYGNCIQFTTKNLVSAKITEAYTDEFIVYPNPASDIATFKFLVETSNNVVISIINTNGEIVIQRKLEDIFDGENKIEINLSDINNGIYFARLTVNDSKQLNLKFLVAH